MRSPLKFIFALLTAFFLTLPTLAAPPNIAPIPDYGGRESPAAAKSLTPSQSLTPAPVEDLPSLNPVAQIGRALGALALVLALVFGVLHALKKFGLTSTKIPALRNLKSKPVTISDFDAPDSPILLLGSQTLPGSPGVAVHLISVAEKTWLVSATSQQVMVLAELETKQSEKKISENSDESKEFEAYLKRQDMTPPPALVIQTAKTRVGETAARLRILASENGTN